jgi:hypothetical protein
MAINIEKFAYQIRKLCGEYYSRNIDTEEYAAQRKVIFDNMENELRGHAVEQTTESDSLIDLVKSCIRKITPVE